MFLWIFSHIACIQSNKNSNDDSFSLDSNQPGEETTNEPTDEVIEEIETTEIPHCSEQYNLRIVPLNIWGQDSSATITMDNLLLLSTDIDDSNIIFAPLDDSNELDFSVHLDDYFSTSIHLYFSGDRSVPESLQGVLTSSYGDLVISWDILSVEDELCPTWTIFVGLEHYIFASSATPPSINHLELLMNGEELWQRVSEDIPQAQEEIVYSTWWWESTFELIRSENIYLSASNRYQQTIEYFLGLSSARVRILINQFWADNTDYAAYVNTDTSLREMATSTADKTEVILQGNSTAIDTNNEYPTPEFTWNFTERILSNPKYSDSNLINSQWNSLTLDVASWHQKFIAIDHNISYVMGMNTKQDDWDTNNHDVFDVRRMPYDASVGDREDVYTYENPAELEPRQDYGMRIEGPITQDIRDVFHERWKQARTLGSLYSENTTSFPNSSIDYESNLQGVLAQLQLTQPEPFGDASILESFLKAIRDASHYILIEDQYFRAPLINEVILEQMYQEPNLLLIVLTQEVSVIDPALKYTYLSQDLFQNTFPNRFLLLQMRSSALKWEEGIFWNEAVFF